jgi:hypothetical protein
LQGLGFVDPTIPFPVAGALESERQIQHKMAELNSAVDSLMSDVQAHVGEIADHSGGTEFISNYAAFQGEWRVWRDDHDSFIERFVFWSARAELSSLVRRYNAFQEQYEAMGFTPSLPGEYDPSSINWIGPLVLGGIVVAGIFGLAWLAQSTGARFITQSYYSDKRDDYIVR